MSGPPRSIFASIYPPDRYRHVLMTAAAAQVGPVSTPSISLFNNDQRGRYLFLYGFEYAPQANANTPLDCYVFKGQVTSGTTVTTFPVKVDQGADSGIAQYGTGAGSSGATSIMPIGSNNGQYYYWPYQFPICILPAGYSFITSSHQSSETFSFGLQWYMGEPLDFRPLLTADVEDFLSA